MKRVLAVVLPAGLGLGIAVGVMILTLGPYADGPTGSLRAVQLGGQVVALAATVLWSWRWCRDWRVVAVAVAALAVAAGILFAMPAGGR
jgi:hypothetical protein